MLVFNQNQTKRVPAVMILHGSETIAVTAGPAKIAQAEVPLAIDREFLEFYERDDVATKLANFSTSDLQITIAHAKLTDFLLQDCVTLHDGDVLEAILMQGQEDFKVTPNSARVIPVEQEATVELAGHMQGSCRSISDCRKGRHSSRMVRSQDTRWWELDL